MPVTPGVGTLGRQMHGATTATAVLCAISARAPGHAARFRPHTCANKQPDLVGQLRVRIPRRVYASDLRPSRRGLPACRSQFRSHCRFHRRGNGSNSCFNYESCIPAKATARRDNIYSELTLSILSKCHRGYLPSSVKHESPIIFPKICLSVRSLNNKTKQLNPMFRGNQFYH